MTTILVVGPDATVDEGLLDAFESAGMEVDRVADAMGAVAHLDHHQPDAVVAPESLPEWSGLRLLRHVVADHDELLTFLLTDGSSEAFLRAQQHDITPLVLGDSESDLVADLVADRVFDRTVMDHRDRRHHLAIATASVLLESLDSLKRVSNYRNATDLIRGTAIVSTSDLVEESVCSKIIDVPGYTRSWVTHLDNETKVLRPHAAAGIDVAQLQDQHVSDYVDAGVGLNRGSVEVRRGSKFGEAVVPLYRDGTLYGAVHVASRGDGFSSFEREQLRDLGRIVSQFVTALEKLQALAEGMGEGSAAPSGAADAGETIEGIEPAEDVDRDTSSQSRAPSTEVSDSPVPESSTGDGDRGDAGSEAAGGKDADDTDPEADPVGVPDSDSARDADESAADTRAGNGANEQADSDGEDETDAAMSPLVAYSDTVAHELRNHINVAEAFLDLGRTQEKPENFDRVEAALERIERLTDEAAAVASDSISEDRMVRTELAEDAATAWERVEAEEGELTVEQDLALEADPDLLELCLENLFRNAADHVGRDVHLRVGSLEDEDGFYVEDDGPGIPEADRERLFGWGVSGGDSDGGIGLAIVDRIVDNHGWDIHITDGREGGARFEVTGVTVVE